MLLGAMFLASESSGQAISNIISKSFDGSSNLEKALLQHDFINSVAFRKMTAENLKIYADLVTTSFKLFDGGDEFKCRNFYSPFLKIFHHPHFEEIDSPSIREAMDFVGCIEYYEKPCPSPFSSEALPQDLDLYADKICMLIRARCRTDMHDNALSDISVNTIARLSSSDINRIAWALFDSLDELKNEKVKLEFDGLKRLQSTLHAINQAVEKLGEIISTGLVEELLVNKCLAYIIQPEFQHIQNNKDHGRVFIKPLAEACLNYASIKVCDITSALSSKVDDQLCSILVHALAFHPMFKKEELNDILMFLIKMGESYSDFAMKLQANFYSQHVVQHMASRFYYNDIIHNKDLDFSNIIRFINHGVNICDLDILDARILSQCDLDALFEHDKNHHGNSLVSLMECNPEIIGEMISKKLSDKMNEILLGASSIARTPRPTI